MKIHVLGICGTFMGGIATIAKQLGHDVTGSDQNCYPPMSTQLEEQGLELFEGFKASDLEQIKPDLVIIGNALSRGNEAVEYVLDNKIPYVSGPQWLADNILKDKEVIAVAGTHGKTTTTSLITFVLKECGLNPSFLVGGVCPDLEVSSKLTDSKHFVIEADEYDTAFFDKRSKFINYQPKYAILNNLEFDHADIFRDLLAVKTTFHHLIKIIPNNGLIVAPNDDENLNDTLSWGCWTTKETFGENADWSFELLADNYSKFEVFYKGETQGVIDWKLIGLHNLKNCLACLAASNKIGIKTSDAISALNRFGGIKRRMEIKGTINNITVYDDFAHHPTAIDLTIQGLKKSVSKGNVIAVLEPRSNTMKSGDLKEDIPAALSKADKVVVYYDKENIKWDVPEYISKITSENYCYESIEEVIEKSVSIASPDDHILIMSNGAFGGIHGKIISRLTQKYS